MKNIFDTKPLSACSKTLLSIVRVRDYRCPKCKQMHNDDENGYWYNKIKYPIIYNEREGSTMDGSYHDWEEHHKCENCRTEYYFENGAY